MSKSNFDSDLEAILSEFSDFSKNLDLPKAKPAAPSYKDAAPLYESAEPEPVAPIYETGAADIAAVEAYPAEAEDTTAESPSPTAADDAVNESQAENDARNTAQDETENLTDTQRIRLRMRGVPLTDGAEPTRDPPDQAGKRTEAESVPDAEKARKRRILRTGAAKTVAPEEVPQPPDEYVAAEKPEKPKLSIGKRICGAVIGLIFMAISTVILAWIVMNVHPNSSSAATSVSGTKISLPDKLDGYMNNLASDVLGELTYIKKIYTIQESDTAGPLPNESCYGTVAIENAQEVMQVIEKARTMGLLEGQEVLFRPDLDFYYDSAIKYYCDETILAICWKEVIEGNTVSCCEVKIADASQLRRKIADDTYGSPNQYYASSLSRQTNAVVAMNADFYQFRDFGIVVYQRELYRYSASNYTGMYSLYNCIDNCFINSAGEFIFMHKGEEISEEALRQFIADNDILFSIAFGPILVENGEVQPCNWYPAGEPTTGYSRAGIGVVDKLHYFYMNLNHSPEKAARWTVTQFAEHMHEKGIDTAYGLDGGQTGELVYRHQPYNYIDFGSERLVSDIVYFATAIPEEEVAH